jgi:hypothetical protein
LIANNTKEIVGILNGTTNFILTLMENENLDFDDYAYLHMSYSSLYPPIIEFIILNIVYKVNNPRFYY